MATMREMTTVLDFRTDLSGLRVYEQSMERIKGLAMEVGKMFGLYFAIDKIGEYVGEIVNAGKEMNRLNIQITQLARNGDDAVAAQNSLFNIAQNLGVEYKEIATTYRGFLIDSQESKISQEELLTATDNVFKSLRVGRASAEEMATAVGAIERGLRLGRIGSRQIGYLVTMPGLSEAIAKGAGMGVNALRDLAKHGKITGEQLIEWLAKPNAELQRQYERMPVRINIVFTRISNQLAYAASQVWKLTNGFSTLGKIIWWVFSAATNAVKWFVNALGGLQYALELVGIALTLVIGPYMLRQAILLTAAFVRMAWASWRVWLPWAAIGAAIVLAALAIQDFMVWMSGDKTTKTAFGDWLGPFDEFKKKMTAMFEDMPIVKLLTSIKDFFTGDISGGITAFTEALKDPKKLLDEILLLVATTIPVAFVGWNVLKFTGIIDALGLLGKALLGIKTQAVETGAAVEAVGAAKAGAKGAAAVEGATAPGTTPTMPTKGGVVGPFKAAGQALPVIGMAVTTAEILKGVSDYIEEKYHVTPKPGDKEGWSNIPFTRYWFDKKFGGGAGAYNEPIKEGEHPWGTFGWIKEQLGWNSKAKATGDDAPGAQSSSLPGSGRGAPAQPIALGLTDMAQLMSALTYGSMPWDVGAMARTTAPPQITTTVQQTNNITANMQPDEAMMAEMIARKVQDSAPDLAGQISRQIQDAIPRTERATQ